MSMPKQLEWAFTTSETWTASTPIWDYKIKLLPTGKYAAWNLSEQFDTLEAAQEWIQKSVWEPLVLSCMSVDKPTRKYCDLVVDSAVNTLLALGADDIDVEDALTDASDAIHWGR